MSIYARKVLSDCGLARDEHINSIDEGSKDLARIQLFTCLALRRAVGHVLHKKDQQGFEISQKDVADELFAEWKTDVLFSEFIERERNLILKQYESSIDEIEREEGFLITTDEGDRITTEDGDSIIGSEPLKAIEKVAGFAAGATPPQVIGQAIKWWEQALDTFDARV